MKVCFFLQRRFAYIGHAMACQIKDLEPSAQFCAIVHSRPSLEFIKNQKNLDYTSIVFDEDVFRAAKDERVDMEYLNAFEREYGIPNLWPYLYIDRIVMNGQLLREYPYDKPTMTYEEMLQLVQRWAKTLTEFLDREKPDTVVISVVGAIGSTLLYEMARKRGIQVINIDTARIGDRIVFSEDDRTLTWVKKRFDEIRSGRKSPKREEALAYLAEFRKQPIPYDYGEMEEFYGKKNRLTVLKFLHPKRLMRSVPWHIKTLIADLKKRKHAEYTDAFIWWALWDKLLRKTRMFIGYNDLYKKPDFDRPFAYLPLHTDPEISTMRYAPYYTDQTELVRAAAHALPIGTLLYVKEHPGMVGYRKRSYYKRFTDLPNVRLIDPNVLGSTITKHASLIVTATSTTAWEALVLKKPVITFGEVFYNDIPGVLRCKSFEDLPYAVMHQLHEWKHDEDSFVDYTSALLEDSVSVDFNIIWNLSRPFEEIYTNAGMRELTALLVEKMRSAKR